MNRGHGQIRRRRLGRAQVAAVASAVWEPVVEAYHALLELS